MPLPNICPLVGSDRHTDDQRKTKIPCHYDVLGYKKNILQLSKKLNIYSVPFQLFICMKYNQTYNILPDLNIPTRPSTNSLSDKDIYTSNCVFYISRVERKTIISQMIVFPQT